MTKTTSGYAIRATAFLPVDMSDPANAGSAAEKIRSAATALAERGFTDVRLEPKFRHRRARAEGGGE